MKIRKVISLLLIMILTVSVLITNVQAVDTNLNLNKTTGSLKITKYETGKKDEEGNYVPLEGVTFEIYKIEDDSESTEIPEESGITKMQATTGKDGVVTFTNLELGRYLVVEAEAPENVVSKIANFIVDIPMTSANGTSLIYNVEVSPKNNTVYGGFVLHKEDGKGNALQGAKFQLQKYNEKTRIWEDYKEELTTSEEGTITLVGLPSAKYRFVETSTVENYILDNFTPYEFEVSLAEDGTTKVEPETITVQNEKPSIAKEITSALVSGSAKIGNDVDFKITTDVPKTISRLKTYMVEDILSEGLTYKQASLAIKGINKELEETTLQEADYTASYDGEQRKVTITFNNENLANYEKLEITYKATLNNQADATSVGNKNTANLTYSTIVNVKYDETENEDKTTTTTDETIVKTGGFWIEKRANNQTGELLRGAKFKIATSEEDAKNGRYLSNPDGTDLTLTTDENGKVSYKGLTYGTYWLVEIEAPTYEENGQTKYYNLLRKPVEITVSENTYTSTTPTKIIVNKKGFVLPNTGGIGSISIPILGIVVIVAGIVVYKKGKKDEK